MTKTLIDVCLQAGAAKIPFLFREMKRLFRSFVVKFVKAPVVQQAARPKDLHFKEKANQLDDNNLVVGAATRVLLDDEDLNPATKTAFLR